MICGPKDGGTYVIEFRTADGESLAIYDPHDRGGGDQVFSRVDALSSGAPLACYRPDWKRRRDAEVKPTSQRIGPRSGIIEWLYERRFRMSVWDDFIRRLEQDMTECRRDLELRESGQLQHRERRAGGAWVDTTQQEIDWHKKTIRIYEGRSDQNRLGCQPQPAVRQFPAINRS